MPSYSKAIDLIYGRFKAAWDADAGAIAGYVPKVEYDNPSTANYASLDTIFARLTVRNTFEGLIGFGELGGAKRLYETNGLLVIQIFVPKTDNSGTQVGRRLAEMARDAYRVAGYDSDLWYRDAAVFEQPPDERWKQFNVNVDYDYTDTK